MPADRKVTFFAMPPDLTSTMPLPTSTTPPLTTAPLVISTKLPGPLANSVPPELVTVPVMIAVPPAVTIKVAAVNGRAARCAARGNDLCAAGKDRRANVRSAGQHDLGAAARHRGVTRSATRLDKLCAAAETVAPLAEP